MNPRTRTLLVLASLATAAAAVAPMTASAATTQQREVRSLGTFSSNTPGSAHVPVSRAGEYRLSFLVSYPTSAGRIAATVDGAALPAVPTPVEPDAYGAVAATDCFALSAGEHDIAISGTNLPSPMFTAQLELVTPA